MKPLHLTISSLSLIAFVIISADIFITGTHKYIAYCLLITILSVAMTFIFAGEKIMKTQKIRAVAIFISANIIFIIMLYDYVVKANGNKTMAIITGILLLADMTISIINYKLLIKMFRDINKD